MSIEESKRHTFDAYCKRIMKNKAVDIQRQYTRLSEHEVTFSELTQRELQSLQYVDYYAPERKIFPVLGTAVVIENDDLGRALEALSPERRIIILLAYLLDMKDDEIAKRLKMNRCTVRYRRKSTLVELRKVMEGYQHDEEQHKAHKKKQLSVQ